MIAVGVDVGSKRLDCHVLAARPETGCHANDPSGHRALTAWLASFAAPARVVMEATSTYHKAVAAELRLAGHDVRLINPRQARDLAKGLGLRVKNDKVDAAVLARCAELDVVKPTPVREEAHERYRDVSRQIQDLTDDMADAKKKSGTPGLGTEALASVQRAIRFYQLEIARLEKVAKKLADGSETLKECSALALGVPGVGIKTARVIVAELLLDPEHLDPKKASAYASVVPHQNSSGSFEGATRTGRTGNARLRKGLFMAATLLAFRDGAYSAFYKRLRAKGHAHKQAIVALMHKLLRTVVAVLKRRSPWVANP